jgi:hypothetical protein
MLIYKTRGHQVRGLNSEIRYEDLGSFTSEVKIKPNGRTKIKVKHEMTFTHKETGISAVGRNRTCAFYACMAEVARHRFAQWKKSPKAAPAVDMEAIR